MYLLAVLCYIVTPEITVNDLNVAYIIHFIYFLNGEQISL